MMPNSEEKLHSYDECDETFKRQPDLDIHLRAHIGRDPFSRNVCGKVLNASAGVKRHMRIHSGENPFSCNVCGKAFSCPSHVKRHMRSHTGEKPYSCNVCGKAFSCPSHVKRHMPSHTGEKPHTCHCCQKTFAQTSYLKRHMITHTGEKPYSCNQCEKAFADPSTLKAHAKRHCAENPHLPEQRVIHPNSHPVTNSSDDRERHIVLLPICTGNTQKNNSDASPHQGQSVTTPTYNQINTHIKNPPSLGMNVFRCLIQPEARDPITAKHSADQQRFPLIRLVEIKAPGAQGKINLHTSRHQKKAATTDIHVKQGNVGTFGCDICEGLSVDEALFLEHFGNHVCPMNR